MNKIDWLKPFKLLGKYIGMIIVSIFNFIKSKEFLKQDKLLHFFVGMSFCALMITPIIGASTILTIIGLFTIAIGREIYGKILSENNIFDWWDIFMTVVGGLIFTFLYLNNL